MARKAPRPPNDDLIRGRVYDRMIELNLNTKEISRRMDKGETYIFQYLYHSTPKILPEDVRYSLAKVLNIDERLLRTHSSPVETLPSTGPAATSDDLIPVLGRASGPTFDTLVIFPSQIQGYDVRPPVLRGASDAYAVDMVDHSMEPRVRPGERLYVKPGASPLKGDTVVVRFSDGRALIREFCSNDGENLFVRNFNPMANTSVPLADLTAIELVVGAKFIR